MVPSIDHLYTSQTDRVGRLVKLPKGNELQMKNNKKVAAVVITAVAITGSASTLANASGAKAKLVSKKVKTISRTFNVNGMGNMGGMRGHGGPIAAVLADLVTKGTISTAESKAVTDAWDALEQAEHSAATKPATPPTAPVAGQISPELTQALKDLVAKGTLTQAKADAITAAVKAAEANRPAMGNGPMVGGFKNSNKDAIITATLGIDATTLHNRLVAGDSLATIAGAKKDALIAALVADETKQIDAAVAAGKITAAQATTLKAGLTAHVTAEVNASGPMGGFGGPKSGRGHGHGDHDGGMGGRMGMPNGTTNGIPSTHTTSLKSA
jgi:polyhydroxyalkanoate synthesis regulator phasin